ncbi:MAG: T9SS type A sorting domain-containing protein [Candidatus Eisenbacteria bacterium]|nr:T9SS type A sorting domain-containing protein [Candidatus Eisenbacteria bacterium]
MAAESEGPMRTRMPALATSLLAAMSVVTVASTTRDATPPALDDFRNSAHVPYGHLTVNVDVTDITVPPASGEASAFYSTDAQATWTGVPLAEIPHYEGGTWGASFPIGEGGVRYYFVVRDDSSASFSSPSNGNDVFPPPPNLTADPGTETGGDVVDPLNNSLDLDGFRVGYSDSFLYATLSNVTGSWPTYHTIFGPWFAYSLVVDNPDAGADSFAYALVYADVPLIADSGLYFVDSRDTSYSRVGDIDYQLADGDLHMRCSLSDLHAQTYFGEDNPSGYYVLGAGTAVAWTANLGEKADSTCAHAYYRRTDSAMPGQNSPPCLSNRNHVLTAEQGTNGAVFRLSVDYTDPDGHLPVVREAVVDGVPHEMGSGPQHDYAAGVAFSVEVDVTLADHEYCFLFSDGADTVVTQPVTISLGSDVPDPDGSSAALTAAWPRPSAGSVTVSFELPAAAPSSVDIYDVRGRRVRRLWSGTGGRHTCEWDGRDETGRRAAAGVYFLRLTSSSGTDSEKIVLLR